MSEETPTEGREKRRWRDDALSVFLVVAALLLGGMYLWDQWQASRLEEQIARANEIGESFAVDGTNCEVSSSGLNGEVLVVSCPGLRPPKIATVAAEVDPLASKLGHFDQVVFRGADAQMWCPATANNWPEGCREAAAPSHPDSHEH